jgi:hypothetical protein
MVLGMGKNGVTGIIVPLEGEVINRVFHHRPIIAMFVDKFPSDLAVGDTAFLYETGGGRVLEGEGSVVALSHETVDEVRKYGAELSVSSEELDRYLSASGKKNSDKMLVLKLQDPIKYVRALKCSLPVGKDGAYMTKVVFSTILAENS